ncbi:hypothetical protein ACSMEV_06775 [Pseudomonas sp. MLB6B]
MVRKALGDTQTLKQRLDEMEEIVTVIDRIGSGYDRNEDAAAALLLFFKQCEVLQKLAKTRRYLSEQFENTLSADELDEFLEQEVPAWRPPYEKKADALLAMLDPASPKTTSEQ